jgi:HEAT repeat protein
MKNDPIELALAKLDEIPLAAPEGLKEIAKALNAKSNLVVAKAARLIGAAQLTDLTPALAATFTRLLKAGTPADKGCAAKIAIARTLNSLECNDADLFLSGMKHRQPEPVWGGTEDTAADLRAICAVGLAGSTSYSKLRALVDLLVDSEWLARAGAVRAIAAIGSESASLLLRLKTFTGDRETEVMADCFAGLLAVDGVEAVPVIASFAQYQPNHKNDEIREAAVLALGASRRAEAVEQLIEIFARTVDPESRRCILLSLATARTEPAIEFLIGLIREANPHLSEMATAALSIQSDPKTRGLIDKALADRTV